VVVSIVLPWMWPVTGTYILQFQERYFPEETATGRTLSEDLAQSLLLYRTLRAFLKSVFYRFMLYVLLVHVMKGSGWAIDMSDLRYML
jgi:hypothetical protein